MKQGYLIFVGGVLAVLCAATILTAQTSIDWHTVNGGGAMSSTDGVYSLVGTLGQHDAGPQSAMTGGAYELTGGFCSITQACSCLGDLNGDGKKDGLDVQRFVGCILTGGDCSCADVDQANGVTIADVPVFVTGLLAGMNCP